MSGTDEPAGSRGEYTAVRSPSEHPHDLDRSVYGRSRGASPLRAPPCGRARSPRRPPSLPALEAGTTITSCTMLRRPWSPPSAAQRCRRALAVEGRLRCLRNRAAPLPARLRPCRRRAASVVLVEGGARSEPVRLGSSSLTKQWERMSATRASRLRRSRHCRGEDYEVGAAVWGSLREWKNLALVLSCSVLMVPLRS